jgi:hypothetical protein
MAQAPSQTLTPAQLQAQAEAQQMLQALRLNQSATQALLNARGGACLSNGTNISYDVLNGDFDLDSSIVHELLGSHGGPAFRPMPSPPPTPASGPSALQTYLYPPPPTAPAGTAARFWEELPGVAYGAGNIAGNVTASAAGALQGLGERTGRQAMAQGVAAILNRQVQRVRLSPNLELYNAAQGRQAPRVRLRVRGLPMTRVQSMVPSSGGVVTQWRVNGAGTAASLRVQGMSAQQVRNTAVMAAENRLPWALRATTGRIGGGVLAFVPSALIDAGGAIQTDVSGQLSFNGHKFLVSSAKSQSGNAVGFGVSAVVIAVAAGGTAAVVSAPVILVALGLGLTAQLVWNGFGMDKVAADAAAAALK